jgi:hypothetical protein
LVECVFSFAVELVSLPLTDVLVTVDELHTAVTLFEVEVVLPIIEVTRTVFIDPFAVLDAVEKITLVNVSVAIGHNSSTVFFVVSPFSLVLTAI